MIMLHFNVQGDGCERSTVGELQPSQTVYPWHQLCTGWFYLFTTFRILVCIVYITVTDLNWLNIFQFASLHQKETNSTNSTSTNVYYGLTAWQFDCCDNLTSVMTA